MKVGDTILIFNESEPVRNNYKTDAEVLAAHEAWFGKLQAYRRMIGDTLHWCHLNSAKLIKSGNAYHIVLLDKFKDDVLPKWKLLSSDDLKAHLYKTIEYRFIDDDINKGFSTVKLIDYYGSAVSVDRFTRLYEQYHGDWKKEIDYEEYASVKTEAKKYIRMVVDKFKEGKDAK